MAALDASKSTVYRRLERLEAAGLAESTLTIDPDGNHRKRFHAVDAVLEFDLSPGGLSVSVGTGAGSDVRANRVVHADD